MFFFQKFKENPLKYGFSAVVAGMDVTAGISLVIEIVDKYGVSTVYKTELERNDDDQCLDIYVKGEFSRAIAYEKLANLEMDEVDAVIKDKIDGATTEYQRRHKT
ncbi:MAG TPA: hypothetical protein O0X23_05455 [Methanocorpusculum sp.]|nr:hypothetical protein [Methanocorpusculum sp.]